MMEENRYKLQPHMFPKTGEQVEDNSYALGANLNPPPDKVKQVIVIRTDLNCRKGKMAAQAAHAAMLFMLRRAELTPTSGGGMAEILFDPDEFDWIKNSFTKVVVGTPDLPTLKTLKAHAKALGVEAHIMTDNGDTEFGGVPTVTALAIGPARSSLIDPITGHLKLL